MESLLNWTAFEIGNYSLSYLELLGTLFSFVSIAFATRNHILTWPTGILSEIFLFILFYGFQLYADMVLQVFFFLLTIYGWWNWKTKATLLPISRITSKQLIWMGIILLACTFGVGFLFSHIHQYLSVIFTKEAAFPYLDSFIMATSIAATFLLSWRKLETWLLWMAVDAVAVFVYSSKEIYFLAIEYGLFFLFAFYGYRHWRKEQPAHA